MIFSENRYPLFGIMLQPANLHRISRKKRGGLEGGCKPFHIIVPKHPATREPVPSIPSPDASQCVLSRPRNDDDMASVCVSIRARVQRAASSNARPLRYLMQHHQAFERHAKKMSHDRPA
jgi:hypothetical protein